MISVRKIGLPLLLLSIFCFSSIDVIAQHFNFNKRVRGSNIAHASELDNSGGLPKVLFTVTEQDYDPSSAGGYTALWRNNKKFKSAHAFIKASINHEYPLVIDTAYTYKIAYQFKGYNEYPNNQGQLYIDTLLISYNPDSLTAYQDIYIKKYSNIFKIEDLTILQVYDIKDTANPPTVISLSTTGNINLNFDIEAYIEAQVYVLGNNGNKNFYGHNVPLYTYHTTGTDYLEVWCNVTSTNVNGANQATPANFELEWTYIDDYPKDTSETLYAKDLNYNFRNNSTRVWLDSNSYQIPLIYEKGYLVYRFRMVRPDSTNYQYPIYTDWTVSVDSGSLGSLDTNGTTEVYKMATPHINDSLNWQYTISFAEEGKYKHVVSYYDGLLKNRQTITRFNTNGNKLIATENVYDYEGRPAIKILPTPISTSSFKYQHGLSTNGYTSLPYKAPDFDTLNTDTCQVEVTPSALESTSLASIYYSSSNADQDGVQKYVPNAQGYPFVQTVYDPVHAGRVLVQGGAGQKLQVGNNHYTRNEYVGADQPNLNQLFGIDIGNQGFYKKVVTKDPNGQVSLSIIDYKGRPITSALLGDGADSNSHALVPNANIPNATSFSQELIRGQRQLISGNSISLERSFYMDVDGNSNLKYVYGFQPMAVDWCPNSYLSVDADYYYYLTDKCGEIVFADQGTLGTTGVVSSPNVTSSSKTTPVFLEQGKHMVNKVLTVDKNDAYAAVDSFMANRISCLYTKDLFIAWEYEKLDLPCPKITTSPCEAKKRQMMDDLYPGTGKYGSYHYFDSSVRYINTSHTWGENSIFGYQETHQRYQDPCLQDPNDPRLRDTMTINGKFYQDIPNLYPKAFIGLFNDSIAEDLLPLHPEYCKLLGCYEDTFKQMLQEIPDGVTAETHGLLYLQDIIARDPIKLRMAIAPLSMDADTIVKYLSTISNGLYIDSLLFPLAYCSCSDSVMFKTCKDKIFANEIDNAILIDNPELKNYYFKQMLQMYLYNRQRFIDATGAAGDCGPCNVARIDTIVGMPVFDNNTYSSVNTISIDTNSFWYQVDGDTTFKNALDAINKLLHASNDTLMKYQDSANIYYDSVNYYLATVQADSIVSRLANCIKGNTTLLTAIKDTLNTFYLSGSVISGNYTPEQVRYALTSNGVTLDDLCNPYIVNYDPFPVGKERSNKVCKSSSFFKSIASFLERHDVLKVLSKPGVSVRTIVLNSTTNEFESNIKDSLTITTDTVTISALYNTGDNLYTLSVNKGTDTIKVYLRGMATTTMPACQNIFDDYVGVGETIEFSNLSCTSCDAYIGSLAFTATVTRTSSSCSGSTVCSILGWVEQQEMTAVGNNQLAGTIPCTQMRDLYQEFEDTLQVYGITGVDHPSYATMLMSFMNYRLASDYTGYQYLRFIESCALADSSLLPQYVAYSSLKFTDSSDANSFLTGLNTVNTNVHVYEPYMEIDGTTGEVLMLIDFNTIPKYVRWQYKDFITNSTIPSAKLINQPLSNWHASNVLGYVVVPQHAWSSVDNYVNTLTIDDDIFGIGYGTHFEVDIPKTKYVKFGQLWKACKAYNIIDVASGGATPSQKSVALHNAALFMYNNGYANLIWNNLQSTVDEDYFSVNKQSFLAYTYSAQGLSTVRVLDTLSEDSLNTHIYTNTGASYNNPLVPGNRTDLYVFEGNGTLMDSLKYFLEGVVFENYSSSGNVDSTIFLNEADSFLNFQQSPAGYKNDIHAYRCADGDYLYVYFNDAYHMYYAFVNMPKYVPIDDQRNYKLIDIQPLPDFGETRNFKVKVQHKTTNLVLELYGRAGFGLADHETLEDVLLANPVSAEMALADTFDNCEHWKLQQAIITGTYKHQRYVDSIRTYLQDTFVKYLTGNIEEELHVSYMDQKFQITLNYYDRAGNLITTVPPEGVDKLNQSVFTSVNRGRDVDTASIGNTAGLHPNHSKKSIYKYNSLNQLTQQNTPDGGEVNYYYDAAGRLIFSQNAKQADEGAYTYNLYDNQSRIVETGEIVTGCEYFAPTNTLPTNIDGNCIYETVDGDDNVLYYSKLEIILNTRDKSHGEIINYVTALLRRDVIRTVYDTTITTDSIPNYFAGQENLRRRVSAVRYYHNVTPHQFDTTVAGYIHAIYYSYDISGNVKKLVHNYPRLQGYGQRYKRVDYDYDLISGKVNMVSYNRGYPDQYYQRYDYDADNRITKVETSRDGYLWARDAEYEYYQHGPLARLSIGEHRVQGVDYLYTIQGWLKGINSDILDPRYDAGKDGDDVSVHSADAYAMSLQYFDGDYVPINADTGILRLASASKNLYNGNIARQTTALMPLPPLAGNYTYDQLNRIHQTQYEEVFANEDSLAAINDYYNNFQYDQDGNLLYLKRRGNGTGSTIGGTSYLMDSLTYYYSGTQNNNKLLNVTDHATDNYTNDIKKNTTTANKYTYDDIGNLIKDQLTGQDTILWNLYNKVTGTRSSVAKNSIDFYYDGAGNRIEKNIIQEADTVFTEEGDFYVRDAQGNILAVYRNEMRYKYGKIILYTGVHDWWDNNTGPNTGGNTYIGDFVGPRWKDNGDFTTAFVARLAANTGWLDNKVSTLNVSYFAQNNSAIEYNLIHNGTDYIVPLFQHSNGSVIADAWKAMFAGGDAGEILNWTTAFFSSSSMAKRQELIGLMCTADPTEALTGNLIEEYNLTKDVDCTTDADNIEAKINDMSDLADYLTTAYNDHTTEFDDYLEEIAKTSSVYNYSGFTGVGGTLLTEVPANIGTHGNMANFHTFLDGWTGASDHLDAVTSASLRASTIYDVDEVDAMDDYASNANKHAIDSALAAIASLTVSAYRTEVKGTIGAGSPVDQAFNTARHNEKDIFYLAEHHVYGSSRLGIKNYWQDQYYHSTDYTNSQIDPEIYHEKITEQIPWYSHELQDVVKKAAQTPYAYQHLGQYTVTNILGQKAYELTNHLGNVQAVVKDKRIHYDLNSNDSVDVYGPSLHAVFDHYPFGMLMPGRYFQDTSNQCVTITHPGGVKRMYEPPIYTSGLVLSPAAGWNGRKVGNANVGISEVEGIEYFDVTSADATEGIEQVLQLNPDEEHDLTIDVASITGSFTASVEELISGSWTQLTSASVSSATQYNLTFTPTTTNVRLQILSTASASSISLEGPTWVENTDGGTASFTYTICTRPRDNYRFGFNGKEKDNEIAGVGNYQDYGFRMYDSRIARFNRVDPLTSSYPELTPYQFASNTPIQATDLDGLEADFSAGKLSRKPYVQSIPWYFQSDAYGYNSGVTAWNSVVDMSEVAVNMFSSEGRSKVYNSFSKGAVEIYYLFAFQAINEENPGVLWNDLYKPILSAPETYEELGGGIVVSAASGFIVRKITLPKKLHVGFNWENKGSVFRFDTRSPDEIKKAGGFNSLGYENSNLPDHVWGESISDRSTIYISTSSRYSDALDFSKGQKGYIYQITKPDGSINVNATLGKNSPFPYENEIVIPYSIPYSKIIQAKKVGN